jgi:hypothetical protein
MRGRCFLCDFVEIAEDSRRRPAPRGGERSGGDSPPPIVPLASAPHYVQQRMLSKKLLIKELKYSFFKNGVGERLTLGLFRRQLPRKELLRIHQQTLGLHLILVGSL